MTSPTLQGAIRISASAGSGKTHRLTRLYVGQALAEPSAYRKLLAVTFTNKAAKELRERIVRLLHELAFGSKLPDPEQFPGLGDANQIRSKARDVLDRLLFDLDKVQVTTIDSFFQSLFRQLAYEAHLPPGLETELDLDFVRQDLLREGLQALDGENQDILLDNLLENLREKGKSFRPAAYLKSDLLGDVLSDRIVGIQFQPEWGHFEAGEAFLQARSALDGFCGEIEKKMAACASSILAQFREMGWTPESLDQKDAASIQSVWRILQENENGQLDAWVAHQSWTKGKLYRSPKNPTPDPDQLDSLGLLLMEYARKREEFEPNYVLASKARAFLKSSRLLFFFRTLLRKRNADFSRVLLLEIKFLLSSLIGDSDVPFILEKSGSRLKGLLIDEFQDTDPTQWSVFQPLARHILSEQGFFAVVGDVKQSIYRWRGGDSRLFREGVDRGLIPFEVKEERLETNYRSAPAIVAFNNWLFQALSSQFARRLRDAGFIQTDAGWDELVQENYQDVAQNFPPDKDTDPPGFVRVRIVQPIAGDESNDEDEAQGDNETGSAFDHVLEELVRLQEEGIPASDIAVLVRSNKQIEELRQALEAAAASRPEATFFQYRSATEQKLGQLPLFSFLVLLIQTTENGQMTDFEATAIESRASSLNLPEGYITTKTGEPGTWRGDWAMRLPHWHRKSYKEIFRALVDFFQLAQRPDLQQGLLAFENLILEFETRFQHHYARFGSWWEEKAANRDAPAEDGQTGILLMTMHKSKGLDFPVVVLPVFGNQKSDNPRPDPFWFSGSTPPWNRFPLFRVGGNKILMQSELGQLFQEETYNNALESLNTLYVACTRPRYGLVLLLHPKKSILAQDKGVPIKPANLLFQVGRNVHDHSIKGSFPLPCRAEWDEDGYGWVNAGEVRLPPSKAEMAPVSFPIFPRRSNHFLLPVVPRLEDSEDQKVGKVVHQVLEQTTSVGDWPAVWARIQSKLNLPETLAARVGEMLRSGFSKPEIRTWFDPAWEAWPELEIQSISGDRVRADRLVRKGDEWVVLDFKTGEKQTQHKTQIARYAALSGEILGKPVKACLLYWPEGQVEWV